MNTLKSKKEIEILFDKGRSVSNGKFLLKFLESESTEFLFAVSSKKFPRAVDRNRIKRLMREVCRKLKVERKTITIIYNGISVPNFEEVNNSIKNLIKKI
jgi:ribonuclease P protein component